MHVAFWNFSFDKRKDNTFNQKKRTCISMRYANLFKCFLQGAKWQNGLRGKMAHTLRNFMCHKWGDVRKDNCFGTREACTQGLSPSISSVQGDIGMCTQGGATGALSRQPGCVQCLFYSGSRTCTALLCFGHIHSRNPERLLNFFFSPGCFDTDSEFIITTS